MATSLLIRLQSLDRETYDEYMGGILHGHGINAEAVWTEVQKAWLQWCIQRACISRGWNWQVQSWNTANVKFFIAYVTGEGKEADAKEDSPAIALLEAYTRRIELG